MKYINEKEIKKLALQLAEDMEFEPQLTADDMDQAILSIQNGEIPSFVKSLCRKYAELLCEEDFITISFEEDPGKRMKFAGDIVDESCENMDDDVVELIRLFTSKRREILR